MSVLVVGLSHRTAPVNLLERVALTDEAVERLVQDAVVQEHVAEAGVLATCNRVEIYAVVDRFHAGVTDVSELLAAHTGLPLETLTPHLYVHYEDRAVDHLFSVASGLDSMVVGERQILGQVRQALRVAQDCGGAGRVLNELMQQALRVGKRVHTDTGIDRAGQSLVSVGLEFAEDTLGSPASWRALVVGAGSMSALTSSTLARLGVREIAIANRTYDRAERLAHQTGGRAVRLGDLEAEMRTADLIVSCTGALGLVVTADTLARARRSRGETSAPAPQVVLDLAMPHDVDPAVKALDGVSLVDLELLGARLRGDGRARDVDRVRAIVAEETEAFLVWQRGASVAPTVVALRAKARDVADTELARLATRLPDLDPAVRDEVAQTVRRVVEKLLHQPTVRVKELAAGPGGQSYALALRELFDLDPAAVASVSEPTSASASGPGPGVPDSPSSVPVEGVPLDTVPRVTDLP